MRDSWTDERLGDLSTRVDRGFDRVDADIRELRADTKGEFAAVRREMKEEFAAVRGEMKDEFAAVRGETKDEFAAARGEMKEGFDQIGGRLDKLNHVLLGSAGTLIAGLLLARWPL